MQMSDSKVSASKNTSSSTIRLSYSDSGNHSGTVRNIPMNNQVTSSANKNDTIEHIKKTKKKTSRDRQQANDNKPIAADMSDLTYSLIDDDHIDDQETINVGNLIIDLESSLEKEKIESEQANNNNSTESKPGNPRSPTSLSTESDASASSLTYRQRAARRRAHQRSPTSMSPCSSSPVNSLPSSPSSSNKPNHVLGNNNNNDIKPAIDCPGSKSSSKANAKNATKLAKDSMKATAGSHSPATNNGHTTRTVFKSSSDDRGELKMKITREKKTSKNEHKIVVSPNHKSPPGCSSSDTCGQIVDANFHRTGFREDSIKSSISSTKECGTSTSIGTITEPECLGPCEPGTSVTLEGIVWQETDGGILVVNVTWRGKTYVGALLDCTRHDWAPPRLCESPSSDIDLKTNKGVRTKRVVTRSNGIGLDEKNLLQTTGKLRNGKGRRIAPPNESTPCNKKQRESGEKVSSENQLETSALQAGPLVATNKDTETVSMEVEQTTAIQAQADANPDTNEKSGPISPTLIGCSEPNCSKKYRNLNGLQYHQSHAHSAEGNSNNPDGSASPEDARSVKDAIDEQASDRRSPHESRYSERIPDGPSKNESHFQQGQKRERTPSPEIAVKHNREVTNPLQTHTSDHRLHMEEMPHQKPSELELPHANSSVNLPRISDPARFSPSAQRKEPSYHSPHGHKSTGMGGGHQVPSPSLSTLPGSKSNSHSSKQSTQQQPPLPATTEEGMKPSGTSTGPPPAPHQANCYFNPAFLANTFNPYNMPPYFPRNLYDQMTPPNIPTSNAALLTRFMNNMRAPPPPDSPSRLLSPSMPKNVPYPPFKLDPGMPPQLPGSIPGLPPMNNPSLLSGPLPPMPPLSLAGGPSLRMPGQGDPLLPPQNQFPPPTGLNPGLGLPGMGNPMGPMGGLPMANPADDPLAKQFPRRFN